MSRASPNVTNGVGVQSINQSADLVGENFRRTWLLFQLLIAWAARLLYINGQLCLTRRSTVACRSQLRPARISNRSCIVAGRPFTGPNGGIASTARVWLARIGQGCLVLCSFSCLMVSSCPRVYATLSALKCVIGASVPPISGHSCSTSSPSTAQQRGMLGVLSNCFSTERAFYMRFITRITCDTAWVVNFIFSTACSQNRSCRTVFECKAQHA